MLYGFERNELPKIRSKIDFCLSGDPSCLNYIKRLSNTHLEKFDDIKNHVMRSLTPESIDQLRVEIVVGLIKCCGLVVDELSCSDELYKKTHFGEFDDILDSRYFKNFDKLVQHLMNHQGPGIFRNTLKRHPNIVEYLQQNPPVVDDIDIAHAISIFKIRIKNEDLLKPNLTNKNTINYLNNNGLFVEDIPGFNYQLNDSYLKNILLNSDIPIRDTQKSISYLKNSTSDSDINDKLIKAFKMVRGLR